MKLSKKARKIVKHIQKSHKNLFITGKAGTGKSTLLEYIKTLDKNMVVLGSTGVAAINVSGQTIHSFFKLKPGFELDEAREKNPSKFVKKKMKALTNVVIDEISMVRSDLLDAIDVFLKKARDSDEPFGGVRLIVIGDLFQLPPIVSRDEEIPFFRKYRSPYFFSSNVFKENIDMFKTIELTKNYRQKEKFFVDILNRIREGIQSNEDLKAINNRVDYNFEAPDGDNYVHIMMTNKSVNDFNTTKLNQLTTPEFSFNAEIYGDIGDVRPNDRKVTFKNGAQVMLLTNNMKSGWVNGSMGTVVDYKRELNKDRKMEDIVFVRLENGRIVQVKKHTWEISEYVFENGEFVRKVIGEFTQMPLKLAWAVTAHKSQGKTFNKVVIDLGSGAFAHGQTYVSISRCTSMDGLVLRRPINHNDIIVDPVILNFFNYMKEKNLL